MPGATQRLGHSIEVRLELGHLVLALYLDPGVVLSTSHRSGGLRQMLEPPRRPPSEEVGDNR
jgi:hypothetical protein